MNDAAKFRSHAKYCLVIAKQVGEEHHKRLMDMAEDWEILALQRENRLKDNEEARIISEG